MDGFFNGAREVAEFLNEQGAAVKAAQMSLEREKDMMAQEIKEIDGVKFRYDFRERKWVQMHIPEPDDDPVPRELEFFTLDGLVDYINENNEGLIPSDGSRIILQVVNERNVALISNPSKNQRERHLIACTHAHVPEINFGKYMDADTFNTMLLSKFIDTEARKVLFSVVKSMTKEQSANTTDDGVGQVVTVKEGVSMASNVTFQNPIPLRPRRTFTEVEQPESNFTLRVNKEAESALFESDGGAWKNEAVNNIKTYLKKHIITRAVIIIA